MSGPTAGVPADFSSPVAPVPQPPQIPPNTIWRGPNGIRAGWRVLIFLAIAAAVGLTIGLIIAVITRVMGQGGARASFGVSALTPLGTGTTESALLFMTGISALIMSRIERRKWGAYGLPLRSAFRSHFWIGALVGFLAISGCLLGIFAFHGFRLTGFAIHGETILLATLSWTVAFVLVGLAEEFSFRGYLQHTLTTGMGFWPSAFLLSALFGLAHAGNPGESKAGLVSVVLFGLLFCLFLRRTGNLWWAVGFHFGWDWGQTFFYGVPDSGLPAYHNLFSCAFSGRTWLTGGTVGPEASVFTPIVLVIVAIVFASVYRENRYRVDSFRPHAADLRPQADGTT